MEMTRYFCTSPVRHCVQCAVNKWMSSSAALPKITVPHRMLEKFNKEKYKIETRKHEGKHFYKGPLVISCKRKRFNHYKSQTYSDFSYDYLASGGWKHQKSVGDYFTMNPYKSNPAFDLRGEASLHSDFTNFGLHPDLVQILEKQGINVPTNIQAITIPKIISGLNVMCCAETGSGKTLAYLLPLLHKIKKYKESFSVVEPNTPYGIILTPSRELSDQIYSVASDIGTAAGIIPHVICGGRGTQGILRTAPMRITDLLISTPKVFSKLLTNRIFSMQHLMHLVLDEADTLLDDSFNQLTTRLIQKLKISSEKLIIDDNTEFVGTQLSLVSATLPTSVEKILGDIVPMDSIERVCTANVNSVMPHVTQKFYRVSGTSKPEELLKLMNQSKHKPTIIFCKNSQTANFLGHFLEEKGLSNVVLHAQMPQKVREGRLDKLHRGETYVLIATDLVSRGIDTASVQQIVNYDFPKFMSDYIHRSGRVGRVGCDKPGIIVSYIQHKWEVDLLWQIETSMRRMTKLHNVNANIKRKILGSRMTRLAKASESTS